MPPIDPKPDRAFEEDDAGFERHESARRRTQPPPPPGSRRRRPTDRPVRGSRYHHGREKPRHDQAVLIFVFGILGLVTCALFAIPAWILSSNYIASCHAWGERPDSLATAGRILAMITGVLVLVGIALFVLLLLASSVSMS